MENSILVALSRQDTLQRQLDVVANNLANMNTTAFKAERMMFAEYLTPTTVGTGDMGDAIAFVRDVATVRDPAVGELQQTEGDLDVAIAGDGYLVVSTPNGERYTRNGHLRLDDAGQLVTDHGLAVLSEDGTPVLFAPEDSRISIARDGTISTESGTLARLQVVRFARPGRLLAVEAGLMMSDEKPQAVAAPVVLQGMLERSNVEPIVEMTRMIDTQRAYDQARVLVEREDDRIRKMLQAYTG